MKTFVQAANEELDKHAARPVVEYVSYRGLCVCRMCQFARFIKEMPESDTRKLASNE